MIELLLSTIARKDNILPVISISKINEVSQPTFPTGECLRINAMAKPQTPPAWYCSIFNRTYFSYMRIDDSANVVMYYDHTTHEVSSTTFTLTAPDKNDHHLTAQCICDNVGHVYLFLEYPFHNIDNRVWKTSVAGDISTLEVIATMTYPPGEFGLSLAYTSPVNIGSAWYTTNRQGDNYFTIFKSLNGATSWDSGTQVFEYVTGTDIIPDNYRVYPFPASGKVDDKVRVVIQIAHSLDGVQTMQWGPTYYMESSDGVTWTNAFGTFSKNVVTNGTIDGLNPTEANNYLVSEIVNPPDDDTNKYHNRVRVDSAGIPYIYRIHEDWTWHIYYPENGVWVDKLIDVTINAGSSVEDVVAYSKNYIEAFVSTNSNGEIPSPETSYDPINHGAMERWLSVDGGTNWTKLDDILSDSANDFYYYFYFQGNYTDTPYPLYMSAHRVGAQTTNIKIAEMEKV